MVLRTCNVCKTGIDLNDHQSGLVFEDKIFVCESCCHSTSEHDMKEWSQSIMKESGEGMPIALWLIHEQNKDKRMFTKQKF